MFKNEFLKLTDIIYAVTRTLRKNTDIDVYVEDSEGMYDKECYYVTLASIACNHSTQFTDRRDLIVSIKYFGGDKMSNLEQVTTLNALFNRKLPVKKRSLTITKFEPITIVDEVGQFLDFLIYIQFDDNLPTLEDMTPIEDYDLMKEININMDNNKSKIT